MNTTTGLGGWIDIVFSVDAQHAIVTLAGKGVALGASLFVQSTLLLASGLLLAHLLKNKGAVVQATIFRVVLVAVLLCPILSGILGAVGSAYRPIHFPGSERVWQTSNASALDADVSRFDTPQATISPSPTEMNFAPTLSPRTVAWLYVSICTAWFVTASLLLWRVGRAYVRTVGVRLAGESAPAPTQDLCIELASCMNIRAPKVVVDPFIKSPCLLGFEHAVILLPEAELAENNARLRYVLVHELSHLLRRDCVWNLLGRVMRAVLFFQPLLYPFLRMMEEASDNVADDYVVMWAGGGADYATQLMEIAQRYDPAPMELAAAGIMAFDSSLGRRVARVLDTARPITVRVSRVVSGAIVSIGIAVLLGTAALCGCETVGAQTSTGTPQSWPGTAPTAVPASTNTDVAQPPDAQNDMPNRVVPAATAPQFVDDQNVVGKWETVDFVKSSGDFNPGTRQWVGTFYLAGLEFMPLGRTSGPWQWSKGVLYHPGDQTRAKYTLKTMSGARYLFLEWMSGDVIFRGQEPQYYVMRYRAPSNAPAVQPTTVDVRYYKSDVPPQFMDDPYVLGKWHSVDFVAEPLDFEAGQKKWTGDLYLQSMEFMPEGRLVFEVGGRTSEFNVWSNGYVWHTQDHTVSRYYIRIIDGANYLFFEWVSGDVIYRAMKPHYYVLKAER